MNYESFLALSEQLRTTRPELLDLAELNIFRSLAPYFPPITPSTHHEAPYRCHLAERFLAQLDLHDKLKPRTQVSHGVRRSLRALFGLLASRGARVGVPNDVYPVYQQLAADACVHVVLYDARCGLPVLDKLDALLICEPLKPWGTTLNANETDQLAAWARAEPTRMLLIDSAYATPPTATTLRLLHDDVAVLLASLSKGWLIPDHAGICIVPSRWQRDVREVFAHLPKDETRLRIGYAALTEHPQRVHEVAAILDKRAQYLDGMTSSRPELRASMCTGYFATAERSFEELLDLGVLAAPASIFGGPSHLSILSSLERARKRT